MLTVKSNLVYILLFVIKFCDIVRADSHSSLGAIALSLSLSLSLSLYIYIYIYMYLFIYIFICAYSILFIDASERIT